MTKNGLSFLFLFLLLVSCRGLQDMQKAENQFENTFTHPVELSVRDQFSRSKYGNYQLKVSGNPFEIGYKTGFLTDSLFNHQEKIFFDQVKEMTGTPKKQKFLLSFLKWYNRDLIHYIPDYYQKEIYGISQFNASALDSIATPFQRSLMLHGAHDIGHAMQDLMLVGCSSVALKDTFTKDGSLWIARNFDFYISEAFAENKIIAFVEPSDGYNYVSITWPGMLGVVSGMNEKGLTVTINAGKSSIPLKAKQPISLVAKEILQFASNHEEAIAIAHKKEVFVSEALLIGSSFDNSAIIIEMSPKKMDVYRTAEDMLVCTNHFQSDAFENDTKNVKHRAESHSQYRYETIEKFVENQDVVDEQVLVELLRKTTGINDEPIGYGNEKSLNQLRAHHGVIFHPQTLRMWVSNAPYQLGAFDMYDLNEVFLKNTISPISTGVIREDTLIKTNEFKNLQRYRSQLKEVINKINTKEIIPLSTGQQLVKYNPSFWEAHYWAGRIAYKAGAYEDAYKYFSQANGLEITTLNDEKTVKKWLKISRKRMK